MTLAVFTKHRGALYPADDDACDVLKRLPDGREVMVEVKASRNILHHKLLFALLKLVVENGDSFDSVHAALTALKYGTEEVDTIVDAATGEVFYQPRSITFHAMDQTRFNAFFDRAIRVVTDRWLVGTTDGELRERVYEMANGHLPERRRA